MQNLAESRRVVGSMFDKVVPKLTDQKDMDVTQRDILESALHFYESFVLSRDRDPAVRHDVGRAYQRVANIQKRLGRASEAEAAYLRGLAVLDPLAADNPANVEYRRTLAEMLHDLAGLYDHQGRPPEAELRLSDVRCSSGKSLRAALAATRRLSATLPRATIVWLYCSIAIHAGTRPRDSISRPALLQEKLARDLPKSIEFRDGLASTLYEMGYLFARTNRMNEALRVYERLAAIREQVLSEFPGNALYQYRLTACLSYLGTLYRREGRL